MKRKLQAYNKLFQDVYKLFADHYKKPPQTYQEWQDVVAKAEEINRGYLDTPLKQFSIKLFSLMLGELEEVSKAAANG